MKTGVQKLFNQLKKLDSGLAVIPDHDPGRNDKKWCFSTFYEFITIRSTKILTVSDKVEDSFFKKYVLRETCQGINLILACGDLPSYYLEYLLNSLNVPLYYVPGNHDEQPHQPDSTKKPFAKGCINIE